MVARVPSQALCAGRGGEGEDAIAGETCLLSPSFDCDCLKSQRCRMVFREGLICAAYQSDFTQAQANVTVGFGFFFKKTKTMRTF